MAFFYLPVSQIDLEKRQAVLTDEEDLKHLTRVLRASIGDSIEFTNGVSDRYEGKILTIEKNQCLVSIESILEMPQSPCVIDLYQGLPKGEKTELIIQKSTELGVNRIVLVDSERVIVKLKDEKSLKLKLERWQKIATESCKQCKRLAPPIVEGVIKVKDIASLISEYDLFLVPYEEASGFGLKAVSEKWNQNGLVPKKIGFFIGPEGGIAPHEVDTLVSCGATIITLGPRILRTETAGLAMIAMLQTYFGDMAGE